VTNDGQGKEVVLALGSNLTLPPRGTAHRARGLPDANGSISGRLANLRGAAAAIAAIPGVTVTAVSPVYETVPVGGPAQPDYLNAVLLARTTLAPRELLARLHEIEADFDRAREVRWGPRTLDLDIITVEGITSDDPELTLPHPRAHERAFVLAPWHDADPAAELPGHGGVATLLAALGEAGVRRADEELSRT
jgi:2-amino-4-hydroxy-6-hydroxymethyldihydropteridine diphosphokinase